MKWGSENLGKKGEKGERIQQSVTSARGALIRLLGPVSCERKWDILTFNRLHGVHLTDIHFV